MHRLRESGATCASAWTIQRFILSFLTATSDLRAVHADLHHDRPAFPVPSTIRAILAKGTDAALAACACFAIGSGYDNYGSSAEFVGQKV